MKLLILTALVALAAMSIAQKDDKVDTFLRAAVKDMHIPGLSVIVLKDGKVAKKAAYGLANVEYDVPAKPETLYLLASITKSFTAVATLMLVEQGKVELDKPVSTYLTDVPDSWKPITVRMLLGHTAGLSDRWEEMDQSKWRLGYPTADMWAASKAKPLDFEPGSHWQYSDQGFFLLGMIIEKVSGERYREFMTKNIFKPCGMDATTTTNQSEIVKNLAQGYTQIGGKWYKNSRRTDYGIVSHFGIVSSVEDMAKFDQALSAGKLLKPETMAQMWTPSRLQDGDVGRAATMTYGMGWFLEEFNGHRIVAHGGSSGTAYVKYPDDKLTVIVLTNLEQAAGGDASGLARMVARGYIKGTSWADIKAKPDPTPEVTTQVKGELENFAKGTMTESLYTPTFRNAIKPTLAQQKASMSRLGPVKRMEFLVEKKLGLGRINIYKAEYQQITLYVTVDFDKNGKIEFFKVEVDVPME